MSNGVRNKTKYRISSVVTMVFLILMVLFAAVPLLQVLLNSFKTDRECIMLPEDMKAEDV